MKRATLLATLIFAAFALLFVGCGDDDDDNNTPGDYFPLTVENQWVYDVTAISPDSTGQFTYEATQTLIHMATKDSFEWYVLLEVEPGDDTDDSTYYRKDSNYLQAIVYNGSMLLRFPVSPLAPSVGQTWSQTSGLATINGEVLAKETITVGAGSFECYKEKVSVSLGMLGSMKIYNWLAPEIGPVRILASFNADSTDVKDMKLKSYTIH